MLRSSADRSDSIASLHGAVAVEGGPEQMLEPMMKERETSVAEPSLESKTGRTAPRRRRLGEMFEGVEQVVARCTRDGETVTAPCSRRSLREMFEEVEQAAARAGRDGGAIAANRVDHMAEVGAMVRGLVDTMGRSLPPLLRTYARPRSRHTPRRRKTVRAPRAAAEPPGPAEPPRGRQRGTDSAATDRCGGGSP
jgi:hypothetical protein